MAARPKAEVLEDLKAAIKSHQLPANYQERATELVSVFSRRIRVSMIGPAEVEKSNIVNAIIGQQLLKTPNGMPTTSFIWSDKPRSRLTKTNGQHIELPTIDTAEIMAYRPVLVELHLQSQILQDIQLLELVLPPNEQQAMKAVRWAGQRTDIVVWCTNRFTKSEARVWESLPEHIQDHSFLCFVQSPSENAEDFSTEYVSAKVNEGDVFRDVLKIGQGADFEKTLAQAVAAIRKEVALAEQASIDHAEVLLQIYEQFKSAGEEEQESADEQMQNPVDVGAVADEKDAAIQAVENFDEGASDADVRKDEESGSIQQQATADVSEAEPAYQSDRVSLPQISPEARKSFHKIVCDMSDLGVNLLKTWDGSLSGAAETLFQGAEKCIQEVSETALVYADEAPVIDQLQSLSIEVLDLLQLLQLEGTDETAMDALDLLNQTKNEIQILIDSNHQQFH